MNLNSYKEDRKKISEETKVYIVKELIEKSYKEDVRDMLKGKKCWRISGQTFETLSKVLVAIGSVVSFAAGVYNETTLSFVSGAISTFSLATLQFASFSYKENKKQSNELNNLLKSLQLETIPVIERTVDDETNGTLKRCTPTPTAKLTNKIVTYTDLKKLQDENEMLEKENNFLKIKIIEDKDNSIT